MFEDLHCRALGTRPGLSPRKVKMRRGRAGKVPVGAELVHISVATGVLFDK